MTPFFTTKPTRRAVAGSLRAPTDLATCVPDVCAVPSVSTGMTAPTLARLVTLLALLQLRAQPAHAEADTYNATAWLRLARRGFCGLTDAGEEGDCQFGDSGSFGRVASSTWATAADSCLER